MMKQAMHRKIEFARAELERIGFRTSAHQLWSKK